MQRSWPTLAVWVWWETGPAGQDLWVCLDETAGAARLDVELPRNRNKLEHGLILSRQALGGTNGREYPLWVWHEGGFDVWVATEKQPGRPGLSVELPRERRTLERLASAHEEALLIATGEPTVEAAVRRIRRDRAARAGGDGGPKPKGAVVRPGGRPLPIRSGNTDATTTSKSRKVTTLATVKGARARPFGNLAPNHVHVVRGGSPGLGRHR